MTVLYYMMNTNDNSHSTLVRPVTILVGLVEAEDKTRILTFGDWELCAY